MDSESIGWSKAGLQQVQDYAQEIASFAGLVVVHGYVLASWGQTSHTVRCRSVRKGLLNSLYGIHVAAGDIRLEWTLAELGIDDIPPSLTEQEKQATIADLLTSRSGVYHDSNYQHAKYRKRQPQRGSHEHGTFWYYNNWDFNALGTIYEQCTQTRIFEEFEQRIARPLGMQDYRIDEQRYLLQEYSQHPSYAFQISARDLARYGLLYLRQGSWGEQSILSREWIEESTKPLAQTQAGPGFGYLWWTCSQGRLFLDIPLPEGSYASYGNGGHYVLVIPEMDMVVAHIADPNGHILTREQRRQLLQLILSASPHISS